MKWTNFILQRMWGVKHNIGSLSTVIHCTGYQFIHCAGYKFIHCTGYQFIPCIGYQFISCMKWYPHQFFVWLCLTHPTPGIEPGSRMRWAISCMSSVSATRDTLPRWWTSQFNRFILPEDMVQLSFHASYWTSCNWMTAFSVGVLLRRSLEPGTVGLQVSTLTVRPFNVHQ